VLANEATLKAQAIKEAAARRKVVELAFNAFDVKALAAFHTGLVAGKVPSNQVPQMLIPVFTMVSNVHSNAQDTYRALILEVLSQKIAES